MSTKPQNWRQTRCSRTAKPVISCRSSHEACISPYGVPPVSTSFGLINLCPLLFARLVLSLCSTNLRLFAAADAHRPKATTTLRTIKIERSATQTLPQPLKLNAAVTSACVSAMAVYLDSICCRQYTRLTIGQRSSGEHARGPLSGVGTPHHKFAVS